uniref:Uncharacterized protein n=1 Tax=Anopheles epiroticus TaxID=199890 RepID=A0A182PUC8_9DIPT
MLSVVITVVCFVCYCCHRNIKKRSNSLYRQQWLETDTNMEIYSVEQCYDPPPSGTSVGGVGGFFMDGGSAGDYQSLPMVTATGGTINHTSHHPQYPYHHQQHYHHQQQQHHYPYTPYPNGPPPSYDTVVAQDELLASVSRRKRTYAVTEDTHPEPEASSSRSCSDQELHDCDKATPLLPKPSIRSPRSGDVSASSGRTYSDDPAEQPLCPQSPHEPGWSADPRTSCNCAPSVISSATISGPVTPIYCRNCGYFVEGSSARDPPVLAELTRNETLLVDYETAASDRDDSDVNRNNVIDGEGTTGAAVASVDIDMRTMQMMTVVASSPSSTSTSDTMNNNDGHDAANETKSLQRAYAHSPIASAVCAGALSLSEVEGGAVSTQTTHPTGTGCPSATANSENNNIIIDSSVSVARHHRDASFDDIIHQCPNTSNQCCNQLERYLHQPDGAAVPVEVADSTNGNTGSAAEATGTTSASGVRSLLHENGLVRLDMSQIIDNTGLPTYEAALKLESSGYV